MKAAVSLCPGIKSSIERPECVVVVDVLRSGTSTAAAIASGARAVRMFTSHEDVLTAVRANPGTCISAGEKDCVKPSEFDLGNTPQDFTPGIVRGKIVCMATTNGPRALEPYRSARHIFYAGRCNEAATAAGVNNVNPSSVVIACAGTRGLVSLEDVICAGGILKNLYGVSSLDDGVRIALESYDRFGEQTVFCGAIPGFEGARRLIELGFLDDIAFCSQVDRYDFAVIHNQEACFVRAPG
ncbi:MAG: 2-phosphosulfolactate phosphatase [Candidatus Brocadiia bacterium]